MIPSLPENNVADSSWSDAKPNSQRNGPSRFASSDVELPDAYDILRGELGCGVSNARSRPIPDLHVRHVFLMGALDDVARVEAGRYVASVPSLRLRPVTMGEEKRQSMNLDVFATEPAMTISMSVLNKGPKQAVVAGVGGNGLDQPLVAGGFSAVKLVKHRSLLNSDGVGRCTLLRASRLLYFSTAVEEHS